MTLVPYKPKMTWGSSSMIKNMESGDTPLGSLVLLILELTMPSSILGVKEYSQMYSDSGRWMPRIESSMTGGKGWTI
jgi:hypothetical protein